ncbi:hypothetical protein ABZP36_008894 [Zizania latifolia]
MASPMHARRAKLKSHLVSAKAKLKHHVTPRRVLLLATASTSALVLLLTLRTLSSSAAKHGAGVSSSPAPVVLHRAQQQAPLEECGRLPAPVAGALIHYATANATAPGRTAGEIAAAAGVLARRAPCNLLVFGLGHGAALWAALNHGGRTLFLEENDALIPEFGARHPGLAVEAHHVAYLTSVADADELLALRDSPDCTAAAAATDSTHHWLTPGHFDRSACRLAVRGLPPAFYEEEWDVIMVDAPTEEPGMMGAIYTAAIAARARASEPDESGGDTTDVLVHDVDQPVEDRFSTAFLCGGYLKEEVGKLRHFAIPSHREGMPFCP